MSLGGGKAMHTLDIRESKSSLAGVMMAAAMEGIGILLLGFVLWRTWRRRGTASAARLGPEDSGRIDALQRAVDVIAVEVERISEGQRFVTRLLSEGDHRALGGGAAEPIRAPSKSAVSSER